MRAFKSNCFVHTGMVGYSYAASKFPDLKPADYKAILPSNRAMLNRSVYADAGSEYNLTEWVPQVHVLLE